MCLSGGGYLSLYTARVLAGLEERLGGPLRTRFDLIAGTSAGGILAMAVALGVPMKAFAEAFSEGGGNLFSNNPAVKNRRQAVRDLLKYMFAARYPTSGLEELLATFIPDDFLMRDIGHRLLVPAYNMTKGAPHSLRTPYLKHKSHAGAWRARDVCLASSAAPMFFPLYKVNDHLYADGAFYANTPDLLALHETNLMGLKDDDVWMLSIGTVSRHAPADPNGKLSWGLRDWTREQTIIKAVMNSQQLASQRQVRQRLNGRYLRLDGEAAPEMSRVIGLDIATPDARMVLENLAQDTLDTLDSKIAGFLSHRAPKPLLGEGLESPSPWVDLGL